MSAADFLSLIYLLSVSSYMVTPWPMSVQIAPPDFWAPRRSKLQTQAPNSQLSGTRWSSGLQPAMQQALSTGIVNPRGQLSPQMSLTHAIDSLAPSVQGSEAAQLWRSTGTSPFLQPLPTCQQKHDISKTTRSQHFRVPISALLRTFYCTTQQYKIPQNG